MDALQTARLKVYSKNGNTYTMPLNLHLPKAIAGSADTVNSESLILQLQKVNPDNSIVFGTKESGIMDYITLKAYKFPFIGLLWYGVVITAIGVIISMVRRIRERKIVNG